MERVRTDPDPWLRLYSWGGAWGYITDPSGLLQLGARFYWPEVGRLIQQDPIGDGLNWYAYVENAPLLWADPEGFLTWRDVRGWYMGGMGGASDWLDRHLLAGQTAAFGSAAGRYDSGAASGWQVASQAGLWGGGVAAVATTSTGLGVGASRLPTAIARARREWVAGFARGLTKGAIGLDVG